ncbi:MAG: glycosyl transferase [Hyphomicrobiales bacterium]|nr:MAG: glycosyl transferase [Hyphomicrobiales bacterium]
MATGKPLSIVHCVRAPVGGVLRHILDLVREQHAAGHHVGLLCDSLTGGPHEERQLAEIKPYLALGMHRIAMPRSISPKDVPAALAVTRHLRTLKPDVLHGHGAKGGIFARLAGTLLRMGGHKVTRLYCPHGGSLHYSAGSLQGRIYFAVERLFERMSDGLVFVSRYEAEQYEQKVGTPRVAVRVVYNGLRDEEFRPVPTEAGGRDFLFIGTLRDLKGPDVFIRALAALPARDNGKPANAAIVGDGDDKPSLEALVAALGLEERVTFHPAMPARKAFAMADAVIVPSRAESMPYIVLEAIAAGKPIVASRVGGIPEILHDDTEQMVPADDPAALAREMAKLLGDRETAVSAAVQRANRLHARFSCSAMAHEIEQFYRDTLDSRAPASSPLSGTARSAAE